MGLKITVGYNMPELLLQLVIVGLILWGVSQLPIPSWIKNLIHVVAAIWVVIGVAGLFGVHTPLHLH